MDLLGHKQANGIQIEDHKNQNVTVLYNENESQNASNEHLSEVHNGDANKNTDVESKNLVGVNFKSNPSLCSRYSSYLSSSPLTDEKDLFVSTANLVLVSTSPGGTTCCLSVLRGLCARVGFANCSGRMFAARHLSRSLAGFLAGLPSRLPSNSRIRTHAHPQTFAAKLLDILEENEELKERNVVLSPVDPSHLVVAVEVEEGVAWGVFTAKEYRDNIARPGDGLRSPGLDTGLNKAEGKIKEALQLLTEEEENSMFGEDGLLALDVGAAPGGWTGHIANLQNNKVGVIAIDPAALCPSVSSLANVVHLQNKAEQVSHNGGTLLAQVATKLAGESWKDKLRLLMCDANLDIRDSLRELVFPFLPFLCSGGVAVVTVKLGRRVGVAGVDRKCDVTRQLLVDAGFREESIRFHWLFSNSKNERTVIAVMK